MITPRRHHLVIAYIPARTAVSNWEEVVFGKHRAGVGTLALQKVAGLHGRLFFAIQGNHHEEVKVKHFLMERLWHMPRLEEYHGYDPTEISPLFGHFLERANLIIMESIHELFVAGTMEGFHRKAPGVIHVVSREQFPFYAKEFAGLPLNEYTATFEIITPHE